jgi:hypothetical protein
MEGLYTGFVSAAELPSHQIKRETIEQIRSYGRHFSPENQQVTRFSVFIERTFTLHESTSVCDFADNPNRADGRLTRNEKPEIDD